VLKSVADLCRAAKRDTDIVARVGGEEFAIMLPETTEAATMQFAERLCRLARDCTLAADGEEIPVTISVGIAGASMRTSGIESLMRDADHALYQAKRSGRSWWRATMIQRRCRKLRSEGRRRKRIGRLPQHYAMRTRPGNRGFTRKTLRSTLHLPKWQALVK
jgi:predicted signal transduction protein with EAL and GGDEF domain